jgi:N-acetylglutamate synthase-like GNAT family acetyltransferase
MTEQPPSLPPGCIIRPAREREKWLIQKLLLQFTTSEALAFDLRIILLNLLILLLLGLFFVINIKLWILLKYFILIKFILGATIVFLFISLVVLTFGIILFLLSIFTYALVNWSRFWVIECNGTLVACGELHSSTTHSMLYYLFVTPVWRSQQLGSCLVKRLVQEAVQPLYLVCKPKLVQFYSQLGFVIVPWHELSSPLQASFNIFKIDSRLTGISWAVMRYQS